MSSWDIYTYSRDLTNLIELIDDFEIPIEKKNLVNLDSQLQYSDTFSVNAEDIVFNIKKKISGTIPFEVESISIVFSHTCDIDPSINVNTHDPIIKFDFQLHIKGYDVNGKEYVNWWHLDKNIASTKPKFTHPYYHFQAGGDELEAVDTGAILLLGSPRIPHPPMDLFLGIHFIINNFFSSKDYPFVDELLDDVTYQDIIKRSQDRMWKPYFHAFNSENTHSDFTQQNIFPLFL